MKKLKFSKLIEISIFLVSITLCLLCLADGSSIKGDVFMDTNTDGVYDQNEKPIPGTKLDLYLLSEDSSPSLVDSFSVGKDSSFSFNKLKKGKYYIQAIFPKGIVPSYYTENGNILLPSGDKIYKTAVINLDDDQSFDRAFIGGTKKQSFIRAFVFEDSNANGGRFSTEPVLPNVKLNLYAVINDADYFLTSKISDKKGVVEFRSLGPAKYRVEVEFPEDYIVGPLGKKVNAFYNTVIPNNDSIGKTAPFTLKAHSSIGLGIGCVKTSKVLGTISLENNSGLKDVEIHLASEENALDKSILTDANGIFKFEKLQKGKYTLEVKLPDGYAFSDSDKASKITNQFTSSGKFDFSIEQGKDFNSPAVTAVKASSISINIFNDKNGNGLFEGDELPYSGAKVELFEGNKNVFSAISDSNGMAKLSPLKAGKFTIKVSIDEANVFSINAENALSIGEQHNKSEKTIDIAKSEEISLSIGTTLPGSISGIVFDDENMNSILDKGEKNFSKAKVALYNENNTLVNETMVSENGEYKFDTLTPAKYYLRFTLPYPYIFSNPISSGSNHENKIIKQTQEFGDTSVFDVKPAEEIENIDAAVFASSSVEGKLVSSYIEEGKAKDGNGNVENIKVELLYEDESLVSEHSFSYTNKNGEFKIKGALPGEYKLRYTIEDSRVFTNNNELKRQYISDKFTLKSKEQKVFEDISVINTFEIVGFAFLDKNADGFYSDDDKFIKETIVNLFSNNTQNAIEVSTAEDGKFEFKNIIPGTYKLKVMLPDSYVFNKGQNDLFTPGQSVQEIALNITPDTEIATISIAASKKASISLLMYYDENLNGSYDLGEAFFQNGSFMLKNENINSSLNLKTDENGTASIKDSLYGTYELTPELNNDTFIFSDDISKHNLSSKFSISNKDNSISIGLVQLSSISGKVWNLDKSNNDISGVNIKLYSAENLISEAQSDENGEFTFKNLLPNKYSLSAQIKAGYKFAREIDTSERRSVIISDNDGNSKSSEINLSMGEKSVNNDIGIGAPGKLGDFAWLDLNKNGLQDEDEPGLSGLTISLYQFDKKLMETNTDSFGRYSFNDVYPGEYTLEVSMPNEVLPTVQNQDFPLVNSAITEYENDTARAKKIIVPSAEKNLNCDFGFVLKNSNKLPQNHLGTPQKDWTPKVPYTPRRQ